MTKNKAKKDADKIRNAVKSKDDKEKQKTLYKTRFSYDGWHYCEFSYSGSLSFLKYRDGQSETVASVKIPDPDDENSEITILSGFRRVHECQDLVSDNSVGGLSSYLGIS